MRWVVAALALAGCSEGPAAEKQYAMFDKELHSIKDECSKAREVANAYLRDSNEKQYRLWNANAAATCLAAQVRPFELRRDSMPAAR